MTAQRRTIRTLSARRGGRQGAGRDWLANYWQYLIVLVGVSCCIGLLLCVWEEGLIGTGHAAVPQPLADQLHQLQKQQTLEGRMPLPTGATTVESVREEFYLRYGGKSAALDIYERGVQAFGSVLRTAERLLRSAASQEPFVMSFAGYSVTVGRGNYYSQSFPFVLERIIAPLLESALEIQHVKVINAAIGGIPSFPYAFCFEHFLSRDPQVISWDFSMNEGRGAAVLESYLRQSLHQLHHRPMVILLDTDENRCQLLEKYTQLGLLGDAMCVGMAKDAVADQGLLNGPDVDDKNNQKPLGFQHWQEFGAPKTCPGRGSWHPKKMEHELIGWMIAMYFVQAVEEAQKIIAKQPNRWRTWYKKLEPSQNVALSFPKPLSPVPPGNNQHVTDLLFGHSKSGASGNSYIMKKVSCRTNFLPATDQEKVLQSIVVSGLSPGITADNIIEERSDAAYKAGWVLDISKVERDTKIKVDMCGGLGYVDLKTALYGIPESGTLRLWLPMEGPEDAHANHGHDEDTAAEHWFDELVICEANEKRKADACRLDTDLEYTVGGVRVEGPTMIAGAAEYLKRKTCVHVGVPSDATVTLLKDVKSVDGTPLTAEGRQRLGVHKDGGQLPDDHVGLVVDVKAKSSVSRSNGACCLSHIVWEQH